MAKNRQANKSRKDNIQVVLSAPGRLFKENYLTPKGKRLLASGEMTEKRVWALYGKKRYVTNPKAKPLFEIHHKY